MLFQVLSSYFSRLEETASRLEMTEILAELFKKAEAKEVEMICYLLQGRVVPLYDSLEFGVATKMMIRSIAQGMEVETKIVNQEFKRLGDLGKTVEKLKVKSEKLKVYKIDIKDVFQLLKKVAKAQGEGSQEVKITLLADLIRQVDPLSARYIVRIPINKMRLGFSDMTILDAFSWMLTSTKKHREEIERAYNVRPDLGYIGQLIKKKGVESLRHIKPEVGTPIRMAKADRLATATDILEKIGKCAVEYKYDGLRLQAHYQKTNNKKQTTKNRNCEPFIKLYSRNLENLTEMFPEIVESVAKNIKADKAIFEGEIVAYNPKTNVSIPFQKTMQRRRKYDIAKLAAEIPVKLYCFELLFCDGKNYIHKAYKKRKKQLKKIIKKDKVLYLAEEKIVDKEEEIEEMFDESIDLGYEGIIAKRLDGNYQAGMRGFNWIKFKRAMSKKLMDTFDVLVMGYTYGEGKRTSFGVGQFLTGVYDKKKDRFVSLTKIGTGLTDEQFRKLKKRISKLEVSKKPNNYHIDRLLHADVWLGPSLVVEVAADEITRSQVHTAGRVMGPSKSGKAKAVKKPGFALRFPRLVKFRDDKTPEQATTVEEIKSMYSKQRRQ